MTAQERQALWFLLVLTLLGTGVRVFRTRDDRGSIAGDSAGLNSQLAAVDSAMGRQGRSRKPRTRRVAGVEANVGDRAPGSLDISAIPRVGSAPTSSKRLNVTATPVVGPVDLDVASQAEIETLPWVGPALAERIVSNRESCGAFGNLEGLRRVAGVGSGIAERLSERVTFSGSPRHPSTVPSQCFSSRSTARGATRKPRP